MDHGALAAPNQTWSVVGSRASVGSVEHAYTPELLTRPAAGGSQHAGVSLREALYRPHGTAGKAVPSARVVFADQAGDDKRSKGTGGNAVIAVIDSMTQRGDSSDHALDDIVAAQAAGSGISSSATMAWQCDVMNDIVGRVAAVQAVTAGQSGARAMRLGGAGKSTCYVPSVHTSAPAARPSAAYGSVERPHAAMQQHAVSLARLQQRVAMAGDPGLPMQDIVVKTVRNGVMHQASNSSASSGDRYGHGEVSTALYQHRQAPPGHAMVMHRAPTGAHALAGTGPTEELRQPQAAGPSSGSGSGGRGTSYVTTSMSTQTVATLPGSEGMHTSSSGSAAVVRCALAHDPTTTSSFPASGQGGRYRAANRPQLQLYVFRPLSYSDHASDAALVQANRVMAALTIPGQARYVPVLSSSRLFRDGIRFGFTAFTIALGSSYFQRLVAAMPHLEYAVRRGGPAFAPYLEALVPCPERRWAALHAQYGPQYGSSTQLTEESTLASIQFTCVYLACKVVDRMPMLDMLRYMLTHLYGSLVSSAQAYEVESKCLEGLGFRLGPYFRTDELMDDWPF